MCRFRLGYSNLHVIDQHKTLVCIIITPSKNHLNDSSSQTSSSKDCLRLHIKENTHTAQAMLIQYRISFKTHVFVLRKGRTFPFIIVSVSHTINTNPSKTDGMATF